MLRLRRHAHLSTLLQHFLASCDVRVQRRDLSPYSREQLEKRLLFVVGDPRRGRPDLSRVRLSSLTPDHVDAWVLSMRGTPCTARLAAKALKQALLWARSEGYPVGDSGARIMVPRPTPQPGRPFTPDQLRAFIARCNREHAALAVQFRGRLPLARRTATVAALKMMALTGLRSGAVGGSLGEDFDQSGPSFLFRSKGRVCRVAVAGAVAELLAARRDLTRGLHQFLFPGHGPTGLAEGTLNLAFKRIGGDLCDGRHVHDLRHSVITCLRQAGLSWEAVTEFIGSKDARLVARTYDHSSATPTARATAESFVRFIGEEVGDV